MVWHARDGVWRATRPLRTYFDFDGLPFRITVGATGATLESLVFLALLAEDFLIFVVIV